MAIEKNKNREMTRAQKRAMARSKRGFQKCENVIRKLTAGNVSATLCVKDRWNPFRRTTVHLDNLDDEVLKTLLELLKIRKEQHLIDGACVGYEYYTGKPMDSQTAQEYYKARLR